MDGFFKKQFKMTAAEVDELFSFKPNPAARNRFLLVMISIVLTPITLRETLLGYVHVHNHFMRPSDEYPLLHPLRPIV